MRKECGYCDDDDSFCNKENLFSSEGEDDSDSYDLEAVVNFWATNKIANIIRQLVANSVQSLERIAPSSELKNADHKELNKYMIRIVTDKNKKTLSIIDSGVGLTKEELECYGSSSAGGGRDLFLVADKVVVRTKHDDGGGNGYVMELSPDDGVVATPREDEKDDDLCYLWSRGTKITLFLKQDVDEIDLLREVTTYEVLVDRYFLTKICYRIFVVGIDAEVVTSVGWYPYTKACYESIHHISLPILYG